MLRHKKKSNSFRTPDDDRKRKLGRAHAIHECDNILKPLNKTIIAVQSGGQFTFGGEAAELPASPGLFVENFGSLYFPLGSDQAKQLIGCCEKAPFGKGYDTVHDDKIRNTWQLPSSSKMYFRNPKWQTGLEELKKTIAEQLNCQGVPISLRLYKMLVYEVGGHFEKHKDTEKEDGMFATLVIQLPSQHEGADLIVYGHDGSQVSHDFGKATRMNEFVCHYAVHYADAEHMVTPVTKGTRVALVYSICWPKTHTKSATNQAIFFESQRKIKKAIERSHPSCFCLPFSHEYTDKSIKELGSKCLKGIDRARAELILKSNSSVHKSLKYLLLIVKMEISTEQTNKIEDMHKNPVKYSSLQNEAFYSLKWYFLNGAAADRSCVFGYPKYRMVPAGIILNPDSKSLRDLWGNPEVSVEGYTGNEGPTETTVYTRFGLFGIPVSELLEFAKASGLGIDVIFSVCADNLDVVRCCIQAVLSRPYPYLDSAAVARCLINAIMTLGGDLVNYLPKLLPSLSLCISPDTLALILNSDHFDLVKDSIPSFLEIESGGYNHREMAFPLKALVSAIDKLESVSRAQRGLELMAPIVAYFSDPNRAILIREMPLVSIALMLAEFDKHATLMADLFSLVVEYCSQADVAIILDALRPLSLSLAQIEALKRLLSVRIELLRFLINSFSNISKVDWFMPEATFSSRYPGVEQFLHGPDKVFLLENLFWCAEKGLQFIEDHKCDNGLTASYTISLVDYPNESGLYNFVKIVKTPEYAFKTNQRIPQLRKELDELKAELETSECSL